MVQEYGKYILVQAKTERGKGMQEEVKIFTVRAETQRKALLDHKRINDTIKRRNKEERQRRLQEDNDLLKVL